jgi:hypothetical protein
MSAKPIGREGSERPLPELLSFLGRHLLFGLAMGVLFASMILTLDVAGLKGLIRASAEPHIALFLLYAFNALTFGSIAMGAAVMNLPLNDICDMRDPERQEEHKD